MIKIDSLSRDVVDIKLPVREEYASVLRLFIAGVGNLWAMTVDEIEDLKLTVSEAFIDVVSRTSDDEGRISVRWRVEGDRGIVTLTDPSRTLRKIAQSPVLALIREKVETIDLVNIAGEPGIEMGFRLHKEDIKDPEA